MKNTKINSEPPAGEFTKEFRGLLHRGNGAGNSTLEAIYEYSEIACDRIDRLEADFKGMIQINNENIDRIEKLQAENEKLVDAIESVNVDLSAAREEIKAKDERIDALEQLLVCYRLNKRPSEKLMKKLDKTKQALKDKSNGKQ